MALSKNARRGKVTQIHYCPCGGEIKMKNVFAKGRMKTYAECEKCKRTERKPKLFV